jgi:hypothetical protein
VSVKRALLFVAVALSPLVPSTARGDAALRQACADAYVRGQVLRKAHKLVEARAALQTCAFAACTPFIVKDCSEWLELVQKSLPTVVLIALDEAGNAVSHVKVSMDGAPLLETLDGTAVEVDPGLHAFGFELASGARKERWVLVSEGEKDIRVVITSDEASTPTTTEATAAPPASQASATASADALAAPAPVAIEARKESAPTPRRGSSFPWTTIGLGIGGVGVLGLLTGTYFGIDAISKHNAALAAGCDDASARCDTTAGMTERELARSRGNLATAFLAVGGGLAASGVLLWLLAPRPAVRVTASGGPTGAQLALAGVW